MTLSFGDIEPPQVAGRSIRRVPLVHLQHGTIGIKQVGYHGEYYRNTIDAFCVYTDEESVFLQQSNGFRPEQLFRLPQPPRYGALLRTQQQYPIRPGRILWFLTWRDYLDEDVVSIAELRAGMKAFVDAVVDTLTDATVRSPLQAGTNDLTVCFHQFFSRAIIDEIRVRVAEQVGTSHRIQLVHAADVELMELMAEAEMLVTDYSSLAYDMTFLGKPVAMYMFDLSDYLAYRTTYIDLREVFTEHVAHSPDEIAATVSAARGTVHRYYAARVQIPADRQERAWIADGGHIDELLAEMLARDLRARKLAIGATRDSTADRGHLNRLVDERDHGNPGHSVNVNRDFISRSDAQS